MKKEAFETFKAYMGKLFDKKEDDEYVSQVNNSLCD